MSESNLWTFLARARKALSGLHMTRQENLVAVGQPDVEGCWTGSQFWLELKHSARPVRETTCLRFGSPIKQNQIDWHKERSDAGGKVYYCISVGSGAERRVYLIDWSYGPSMLVDGVTEKQLQAWTLLTALDSKDPAKVVVTAAEHEPGSRPRSYWS